MTIKQKALERMAVLKKVRRKYRFGKAHRFWAMFDHDDYDPKGSKTPNCAALMESIEKAEQHAERQCKRREEQGSPLGRPSTTVHQLTRAIRAAAEAARPKK